MDQAFHAAQIHKDPKICNIRDRALHWRANSKKLEEFRPFARLCESCALREYDTTILWNTFDHFDIERLPNIRFKADVTIHFTLSASQFD